jgi:hypothetical protein
MIPRRPEAASPDAVIAPSGKKDWSPATFTDAITDERLYALVTQIVDTGCAIARIEAEAKAKTEITRAETDRLKVEYAAKLEEIRHLVDNNKSIYDNIPRAIEAYLGSISRDNPAALNRAIELVPKIVSDMLGSAVKFRP